MHNAMLYLKKYSPIALSCIASVGVVASVVAAVKATPIAMERIKSDSRKKHNGDPSAYTKKEALMSAWKYYVPTAAFCISTIICIMGANALNVRKQASIASAYALVKQSYKEYMEKLKNVYGEEAHNSIVNSIITEKCKDVQLYSSDWTGYSSLDFGEDDALYPEARRTFYDSFSQRYFESTISKVIQAEYHLNRNFMFEGVIPLNDFYEFLGLEKIKGGDSVGWSSCDGDIYWIDFSHRKTTLEDGMEIFVIDMVFEPTSEWMDDI